MAERNLNNPPRILDQRRRTLPAENDESDHTFAFGLASRNKRPGGPCILQLEIKTFGQKSSLTNRRRIFFNVSSMRGFTKQKELEQKF